MAIYSEFTDPFKIVIFHSYVSLPEGTPIYGNLYNIYIYIYQNKTSTFPDARILPSPRIRRTAM